MKAIMSEKLKGWLRDKTLRQQFDKAMDKLDNSGQNSVEAEIDGKIWTLSYTFPEDTSRELLKLDISYKLPRC